MRRYLPLLLFLVPLAGWAALSRTFPTSAVTTVRLSAYQDALETIIKSTDTIKMAQWEVLDSSWTWTPPNQLVSSFYSVKQGTQNVNVPVVWTLQEYTDKVYATSRLQAINEVMDLDMEQYFVFPGTNPPVGWLGFCSQKIDQKVIPMECP